MLFFFGGPYFLNTVIMRKFISFLTFVLSVAIAMPVSAEITIEKGGLYMIRSKKYPDAVLCFAQAANGTAVQLKSAEKCGASCLWNVADLSGSYRFINPFDNLSIHATSADKIEITENNGSDESQLWKLEPVTTPFPPAEKPKSRMQNGWKRLTIILP